MELALVVGRAPGEHPVADDDRLERRRVPELERVDGLDVVVAVDDDRRGVRRRGASRRRRPGGRRSRPPRRARCPSLAGLRRSTPPWPAIGCVLRQGRDAGNAKEFLVRLEPLVAVVVEERLDGGVGGRGGGHRADGKSRCRRESGERAARIGARALGSGPARGDAPSARPAVRRVGGSARVPESAGPGR